MNYTDGLARFWTTAAADVRDLFIVDLFAGGGGASEGIRRALGRCPDIAINHDPAAVEMHTVNHPRTQHYCEDVFHVDPREACGARRPDLLWASPDCTFHSRARGCAPIRDADRPIRGLAWVVVRDPLDEDGRGEDRHPGWADTVRPKVICLENVPEFARWGPLDAGGRIIPERSGETFARFVGALEALGYAVEWRVLKAHLHDTPTSRERLYLVARCDGQPIVWPAPTHGPGLLPFRTAAECIDWTVPCPSVLLTRDEARELKRATGIDCRRPLADATLRRVAEGVRRYVVESASPYIVNITHGGRLEAADQPLRTITCAHGGEKMIAAPVVVGVGSRMGQSPPRSAGSPLNTVTGKNDKALLAPLVARVGNGERTGQAPRAENPAEPLTTVTAGGCRHAVGAATLVKFYGTADAVDVAEPLDTVTTLDRFGCVVGALTKFYGSARAGAELGQPAPTVTTGGGKGGGHVGLVTAHVVSHYGQSVGREAGAPLATVTADGGGHHGLVTGHIVKHFGGVVGHPVDRTLGAVTCVDHHGVVASELVAPPLDEATAHRARRLAELLVRHCPALAAHVGAHGMITCRIGGDEYVLVDVGLRMLTPRELARAQGFGDEYVLTGTRRSQIERIGNSVCPNVARAVVAAQFAETRSAA